MHHSASPGNGPGLVIWDFAVPALGLDAVPRHATWAAVMRGCRIVDASCATLWRWFRPGGGCVGMAQQAERRQGLAGSASLVMVQGAVLLRPEQAVFEAMLAGWRSQQRSRLLAELTVTWRERIVRRFTAFTGELPWRWGPGDVEEWTSELLSGDGHAHATIRSYQRALASFLDYLTDARYGWAAECEARFGTYPVQVCHEWNTAVHAAEYEGQPGRRALTKRELQDLFDYADERVDRARERGRKGWLTALRDAAALKTAYAFGLRRRELVMLDLADFGANPHAPEFGEYGVVYVRWGKASKGSPPKRRSVLTVFPWSVRVLRQWAEQFRGLFD